MDRALRQAIEEQRRAIFDAQAIVQVTASALDDHFGDWPINVPYFPIALSGKSDAGDDSGRA